MDDLSGLDWSSRPAGNQPKPPVMNSFSSFRASPMTSGQGTPLAAQGPNASQPKQAPPKGSQDSFSNLMNFGSSRATQNLTLAERQAQLEAEKRQRQEESRRLAEAQFGNGTQWEALGSRGFTPSPALQQPATASRAKDDDDDLFAAFNRDTKVDNASHYPPPAPQKKGLDLSDPTAWTTTATTTTTTTATSTTNTATATDLNEYFGVDNNDNDDDPFGLNEFKLEASARGPQTAASVPAAASDDFDFLGDLARPVDEVRREQEAKQQAARQAVRESSRPEPGKPIEDDSSSSDDDGPIEGIPERVPKANRDSFDRAVAQLVDYGFSPEEARRGLLESGAGSNAQAAANWLLDEAHRKAKENAQGRSSHRSSPAPAYQHGRGEVDLAKSAAAVGSSLFKSANSLWKTGQKKMQQAVAEFQQDGGDPSQPKWMREAHQEQTQARAQPSRADVTDEALMLESGGRPQQVQQQVHRESRPSSQPRPPRERGESPAASSAPASRNSPAPRWQQQPPAPSMFDARSRLQRLKVDDDDGFSVSVSANRRKKASPAPEPPKPQAEPDLLFNTTVPERPSSSAPPQRSQRQTPVSRDRPQVTVAPRKTTPKPARQIPSLSPDALRDSTAHRHQGTAHFKRGDFASAHASYTAATSSVPSTHPLMIVLLTNRALTALKIGEPKEAVTNADEALRVIGPGNGQGETVAVRNENGQDENRDMKELYGKALSRKAEALEQMEKWADAGSVWQLCVEAGVGGPLAIKGRQRCQEALTPKPKAAPKPVAKPRPAPSASLAPAKDSEAVIRLREANEAAVREDDEKFALADKVDAKVSAWRDGKRDNLRALISSLDNVLWENSGWKKVGLHELLQPNKVKISYMKAIAKTHPDKLPQDANTEVRLIAGLVFSTLNESWDKFKSENGL